MGEIADALRRADPHEPHRAKRNPRQEFEVDRSLPSSPPLPEQVLDSQPTVETHEKTVERSILQLSGGANDRSHPARISLDDPRGQCAQQYRRLAIRLRNLANARHARSIVITSAQAGEGKTTTACNLAIALATTDLSSRVVLIDLDLHRANIAPSLGIQIDASIADVLRGEVPLDRATRETDLDGLFIVAANRPAKKPDQLLASKALAAMIAELESHFDCVIIDTAPILATSDAQVILQHAATALLVVREGVSQTHALHEALEHVSRDKVLASLLNSSRRKRERYGYYADYHGGSEGLESSLSVDPEERDTLDVE